MSVGESLVRYKKVLSQIEDRHTKAHRKRCFLVLEIFNKLRNIRTKHEGVSRSRIENQGVFQERRLRCLRNVLIPSSQSSRKDDVDSSSDEAGPTLEGFVRMFFAVEYKD